MSAVYPPHKRRKLMPQSVTDSSATPSLDSPPPPVTPISYASKASHKFIPTVNSTPIRNYFSSFCSPSYRSPKRKRDHHKKARAFPPRTATPRTLWSLSDKIIPYPPPSKHALSSPFSSPSVATRKRRHIDIDVDKFDAFYHPLTATIESRPDLNVFNDSYFGKTKKFYDEQPFLDPALHCKMRDDLFKLLCDFNDQSNTKPVTFGDGDNDSKDADYVKGNGMNGFHHDTDDFDDDYSDHHNDLNLSIIPMDRTKDAADALDTFGDHGITKMLEAFDENQDDDVRESPMDRAQRFIDHLRSDRNAKKRGKRRQSSYESTCEGMVFLSGVLEYIVSVVVDSAGVIAKANHSIITMDECHADIFRTEMEENQLMVTQYDRDVFEHDINRNLVVIRPIHIRHAIHDDDGLFWLQQSIQTVHLEEEENDTNINGNRNGNSDTLKSLKYREEDIQDALDNDCVSHICSFFRGDLPMLSSLARVNTTFYAMTSSNLLWKPIAIRCFLFNPEIVQEIAGEGDDESGSEMLHDFRSYISMRDHVKLCVMRERWMKQQLQSEDGKFEIYVRINPVYTELHHTLYHLLYGEGSEDMIDHETYDVFQSLLEIFGNRRDFITVSQIINHVQCFNAKEMQHRFGRLFEGSLSEFAERELKKVIEIEYDNNDDDDEVLFLEVPLSDNCIEKENTDCKRHCLWLGKHIAVFSVLGRSWNKKRVRR